MTINSIETPIDRDRWGRPLVVPPGGGKAVAYSRCTSYVDCVEDKYSLQKWMQRQVALGLASRDDLRLAVNAHRDDKRELDRICDAAKEASASQAKATVGTALHSFTEQLDRGQTPENVPVEYAPDLAAYVAATEHMKHDYIEQFCVQDPLKIGGTPDRIVSIKGKRYIADLKTGSIEFGTLKIAMQLAVYARSFIYGPGTARTPHDASIEKGIVIHLPAGSGTCTLYWIDLLAGWQGVQVAKQVREKRGIKFTDLTEVYGAETTVTEPSLADQINALTTADAIRDLWAAHESEWTPELTDVAKQRLATLQSSAA